MITKEELQQLFDKMQKAGWNMQQELAWGYFFKNETHGPLQNLADHLSAEGYEIVDINQSFPDEMYWLQTEKIEQHDVESLHLRNQQLSQLAEQMHIKAYDGMDVAPKDV